ncbi:hypothetical protein CAPTEDRAFT_66569, partial [Capitella teleta]
CPAKCSCDQEIFECLGSGLKRIPPNIPNFIRFLGIGFDSITRIPNNTFIGLVNLVGMHFVEDNLIVDLKQNDFEGFEKLEELNLAENSLKKIEGDHVFGGLNSLKKLSLQSNMISTVNISSFAEHTLRNIVELDLSGNPFECTCELFWFVNWANENKHKLSFYGRTLRKYICNSPNSKKGTRLEDLKLSPEEC